jgi:drug/metabolite transporter superfamily protein YnfA
MLRRKAYINVVLTVALVLCTGAAAQGNVFAGFEAVLLAVALLWKLGVRLAMWRLRRQGLL